MEASTSSLWIHPGLVLIIGGLLTFLFKGKAQKPYILIVALASFAAWLVMVFSDLGTYGQVSMLDMELTLGRVDKLSLAFGFIFTLAVVIGIVFSLNEDRAWHHAAAFVYAGGALGVAFAGDFLSLLIFWELMAFSSVFLILFRNTKESRAAAYRYILVHAFSGVAVMGGIFFIYMTTGSMDFTLENIQAGGFLGSSCMLVGFLINAAVPPFGPWLPDAYPQGTVHGAVFLSAFTTKSAVYALARGFAGTEILIVLGVIMAIWGVVYAVLENDIRRLLAYHIISQVGYMVAAVGIGTQMAINGAVAHALAHILYKGLLFMGTGSVLYMTGKSKLTELGGLYKRMPKTFFLYMIGGFAISSVPFFSGFVSKSIVLSAAGEEHLMWAFFLLTLASAGTFLHTGLKLPYYTFMAKDQGVEAKDPPMNMIIGMAMAAFMCIAIGCFPQIFYKLLPYDIPYHPYTPEHLVWTSEILLLTWLVFYIYISKLGGEATRSVDTDWFYRKGGVLFYGFAVKVMARLDDWVGDVYKTFGTSSTKCIATISYQFDVLVVDGFVNGVANTVKKTASKLSSLQTGNLQNYVAAILLGLLLFVNLLAFLR